jgi:hypothetical protein
MRNFLYLTLLLIGGLQGSQPSQPAAQPERVPSLSIEEEIDIRALDLQETELRRQWDTVEQQKEAVAERFKAEHPGWHLLPDLMLNVAKDAPTHTSGGGGQ